jgi:hypothetical protein
MLRRGFLKPIAAATTSACATSWRSTKAQQQAAKHLDVCILFGVVDQVLRGARLLWRRAPARNHGRNKTPKR